MVTVCVPNESVTLTLTVFGPAASEVSGRNPTVTVQVAPGASVVLATSWPLPVGPQLESSLVTVKSAVLVPDSAPCAMPVMVTLPVLVSVNACDGSAAQSRTPRPEPGQLRVWVGVQVVGVRVAVWSALRPRR